MYWKRPSLPASGASLEPQTAAFAVQTRPVYPPGAAEPQIHTFTMSPAKADVTRLNSNTRSKSQKMLVISWIFWVFFLGFGFKMTAKSY